LDQQDSAAQSPKGQELRLILQAFYFIQIARSLGVSSYGAFVGVVALVGILFPENRLANSTAGCFLTSLFRALRWPRESAIQDFDRWLVPIRRKTLHAKRLHRH
jgi:hypothetical protein